MNKLPYKDEMQSLINKEIEIIESGLKEYAISLLIPLKLQKVDVPKRSECVVQGLQRLGYGGRVGAELIIVPTAST
jgi:hypothetical protein